MRILFEKRGTRLPIHYKEWYGLLREAGLSAEGTDPVSTFLTQITRSPLVQRVDGAVGCTKSIPPSPTSRRARSSPPPRELAADEEAVAATAGENGDAASDVARVREAHEKLTAAQRRLDAIVAARSQILRERLATA